MMVNTDIKIVVKDSEAGREIDGVCRDLSATGISISLDEPIEKGTNIIVKLDAPNLNLPPLDALAKVVRCSIESNDTYLLGAEITEMV